MPLKTRRVHQEAVFSTARIFRTIGGPLRYRMPQSQKGEGIALRTKTEPDIDYELLKSKHIHMLGEEVDLDKVYRKPRAKAEKVKKMPKAKKTSTKYKPK